jgi:hypothetical protein
MIFSGMGIVIFFFSFVGVFIGFSISLIGAILSNKSPDASFFGDTWQLVARPDSLQLQLTKNAKLRERWFVPLNAVSRVETARTADFTPARKYGSQWLGTPEHEWQVFLFLNDGTRRVIHQANAARDDCAALAASIREYVEQAHHSAPSTSSTAPSAPAAYGFDL